MEFKVTQKEAEQLYKALVEEEGEIFKNMKVENVNHPSHYNREGALECIEEMLLIFGIEEVKSFCKLNAWKYRYRAADKNGKEDLKKSDFYMNKYKELCDEKGTPSIIGSTNGTVTIDPKWTPINAQYDKT